MFYNIEPFPKIPPEPNTIFRRTELFGDNFERRPSYPKRADTDTDADAFRSEVSKSADRSVGAMHTHDAKGPKEQSRAVSRNLRCKTILEN